MKVYQLFPFEYVEKHSKIIIYGLGNYGMSYIEQVQATKWCTIIGVSDTNAAKRIPDYPFLGIDQIRDTEADYIIIAIAAAGAVNAVYIQLREKGISDEKIISTLIRTQENYKKPAAKLEKGCKLRVLLRLGGGFGDCVVYLSVYERIADAASDAVIDIQCLKKSYGEALYKNRKCIGAIFDESDEKHKTNEYDLVLFLQLGITVLKYDEYRCRKLSPELNRVVQMLLETAKTMRNDIKNNQVRFAIQTRMAITKGWNRYYTLGHGNVLNLSSDMVKIKMLEDYKHEYDRLHLRKFITLNRGADKFPADDKKMQVKVWPLEYYEQLIILIKAKFPEYEIIQLGGNDTEQIKGVDCCIKGQSFELVKYILQGSALHFDCEGGLVHLATALGTKCAVVFGPTSMEYYGYPQNINITAGKCHNCLHLMEDWYVKCLRGQEKPECMYGITPDTVFEKVSRYLDTLEEICCFDD